MPREWFAEELMEEAQVHTDPHGFRMWMLERLRRTIPFESAIYVQGPDRRPAAINKDEFLSLHPIVLRERRFEPDLARIRRAVARRRVIVDNEAFSARERSRSPFIAEVLRPQRIRSQLVGAVTFRGRQMGALHLCRHDRDQFRERDRARLERLIASIGVADAVVSSTQEHAGSGLTAREREVTRLVCRGMANHEIALVLGTSPNTVRNQLHLIFDKLGLANRAELAAWAYHHRVIG